MCKNHKLGSKFKVTDNFLSKVLPTHNFAINGPVGSKLCMAVLHIKKVCCVQKIVTLVQGEVHS